MGGIVGESRRCLHSSCHRAVAEIPCIRRDRAVVEAGAGIEIALGCRAVESEERLRCRIAKVAFDGEDSEVRAEDSRFATRLDAVGVEDVAEIAADEQARRS